MEDITEDIMGIMGSRQREIPLDRENADMGRVKVDIQAKWKMEKEPSMEERHSKRKKGLSLEVSSFTVLDGNQYEQEAASYQLVYGTMDTDRKKRMYRVAKRGMDVVCCGMALLLLLPVFLITAMAIWVEDGGPVIFAQDRNGLNGKVFRMYKFRSMCKDAEILHTELVKQNEMDGPAFKMKKDPRVTKVGRIIRKTSIDELPQLVNILKGEMSIVGPRPLPTYETEQCNAYQKQRLAVKPGLTCYWQCSGRNDISFDEWMEMDLKYIRKASLWVDMKIIFQTVKTVISRRGAY